MNNLVLIVETIYYFLSVIQAFHKLYMYNYTYFQKRLKSLSPIIKNYLYSETYLAFKDKGKIENDKKFLYIHYSSFMLKSNKHEYSPGCRWGTS